MRKPTIVAMGGGGFSMEPENPLLDDYVLSLVSPPPGPAARDLVEESRADACREVRAFASPALPGKALPRVCFVPTASGDAEGYVERFRAAFAARAEASVLDLFRRSVADLEAFLLSQEVIYVGGGNTANMLAVWRVHGVDRILRAAWERGVVLCGLSAGSLCWFEGGVTDSFGALASLHDGLGLLPGSHCPHYDGEPERKPTYERFVRDGMLKGGWAADDGVALHFEGTELVGAVASRPSAMAWRVERSVAGELAVRALRPRYLGAEAAAS